jgi:alpha-D-ribose 1-methylphosphonate 5-triphosphate synthase subunit PhnH
MSIDLPGFTDPVTDAQACFRAVLDAMAHPGRVTEAGVGLTPPAPLDPAAAAVLLTLTDVDTPLWIDGDPAELQEWLAFHCGTRSAPLSAARFVWARSLPDLAALASGSDEAPEDSTTVILQLHALGTGASFRLAGPGLKATEEFRAEGLPPDFAARWHANHGQFPRGIDLVFTAGTKLAAFPRSVAVEG